MAAARVVMLSNPASGTNRKHWHRVEAFLAAHPQVIHHVTPAPGDAATLIAGLAADPPEVVAINGGDGTVAATIGLILHHWPGDRQPLLIVLPGGTANMTAGDIGTASAQGRAFRRFGRWLARGAPLAGDIRSRHIMRVEGAADGQVRHGMFLGTGAVMQVTRFAHSDVHARGLGGELSLALILIRALWGLGRQDPRFYQPTDVHLTLPDTGVTRDAMPMLIVVASTLERLTLGIRPFWGPGDAAIGLTTIRGGARHFARAILSLLRGRPNRHVTRENGYESFRAGRIELRFEGELNLDGELFATGGAERPLTITAEGPVRFLCPR